MLIRRELFYIVYHWEILNHNTFSELHFLHSNNCGGELWYSDSTNMRKQTLKISILDLITTSVCVWGGKKNEYFFRIFPINVKSALFEIGLLQKLF